MLIGYQGVAGSYSEATLQDYIKEHHKTINQFEAMPYSDFKSVVDDLLTERLDLIVVPVENSTTGIIARVMDLLRYQPVMAIAELYQPVQHSLLGVKGSDVSTIKKVFSHPEALSQCVHFFDEYPMIESLVYEDTAKAASYVKMLGDKEVAAIASPRAGEIYDLITLKEKVQDESTNTTRFYVIEKHKGGDYTGDCLSMYIETRHEAGALLKVLQIFDAFNCNMINLSARPIMNRPFTYGFFLELSIVNMSTPVDVMIQTVQQVAEYVQILGRFNHTNRQEIFNL
ncbi:prephenate dehydratase [Aerococcaceae bacterium WGS1372]